MVDFLVHLITLCQILIADIPLSILLSSIANFAFKEKSLALDAF